MIKTKKSQTTVDIPEGRFYTLKYYYIITVHIKSKKYCTFIGKF